MERTEDRRLKTTGSSQQPATLRNQGAMGAALKIANRLYVYFTSHRRALLHTPLQPDAS
jgi:hypothetical protein